MSKSLEASLWEQAQRLPRGELYDALKLALTTETSKGRILREAPGEVPCPDCGGRGERDQDVYMSGKTGRPTPCRTCSPKPHKVKSSGTVPGTDEASVVARAEALGRMGLVCKAAAGDPRVPNEAWHRLHDALDHYDYPGALEAAAEVVEAEAEAT